MRRLNPIDIIARAHAAVPDEAGPVPRPARQPAHEPAPRHGRSERAAAQRREPSFDYGEPHEPPAQSELPLPPASRRAPTPPRAALALRDGRKPRPRWRRRAIRLLVLAALLSAPAWLWRGGHADRAEAWIERATVHLAVATNLTVGDILVEGRRRTGRRAIARALAVPYGAPILEIDLAGARRRIEALPWVATAAIERRLPDTLFIRITERRPIARWRVGRRIHVVDRDGVAIRVRRSAAYAGLPLVSGAGAPAAVGALLDLLKARPRLAARVVEARRLGKRRWDLMFDNGTTLMLPVRNPGAAWARFASLAARRGLLDRGLVAIDMRLPDRIVLRARQPVPPPVRRPVPGRAT